MYIPSDNPSEDHIIHHSKFDYTVAKIEACLEGVARKKKQRGILIVGPSGAGKTSLLEYCHEKHPAVRERDGVISPIIFATLPSVPTKKNLASTILTAMNEPVSKSRTENEMTDEIIKKSKMMKVKLIIIDEFQHFINKDNGKIYHGVSDSLKILIEKAKVSLVAAGMPDSQSVINANSQLKRRFQAPITLERFNWFDDESRASFIGVLNIIQNKSNLTFPDLTTDHMAYRWYCSTGGLMGRLNNLLEEISFVSKFYNITEFSLSDLERASKTATFDMPEDRINSFSKDFDTDWNEHIIKMAMQIGECDQNNKKKPIIKGPSDLFGD